MNTFALLKRDKIYRNYWLCQIISNIGSMMQNATLSWMALQMTGSSERLGFIMVLLYLPALVLAIPAGVLADRFPRRNLLLFTQGSMMLAAGGMALLLHEDKIVYPHVAVFALIFGCLAAIGNPIRLAFNVEMAGQGNSAQAVSLNAMSF